jgi:hypothetical protein
MAEPEKAPDLENSVFALANLRAMLLQVTSRSSLDHMTLCHAGKIVHRWMTISLVHPLAYD